MVFTCRVCKTIFQTQRGLHILHIHISKKHPSNLEKFDHEVEERKRIRLEDPVEDWVEDHDDNFVEDDVQLDWERLGEEDQFNDWLPEEEKPVFEIETEDNLHFAEEEEEEQSVNDRSGGSWEGKAFLIPVDQLPDPRDPRMKYYVNQMHIGMKYYGHQALRSKTFLDFKDKVKYFI
jgi:hypothetical protein